jgi:hypothetical protein
MDTNELYAKGKEALEKLAEYAAELRSHDNMPLSGNRPFVAMHDDLALELERMKMNHMHLLERSQAQNQIISPN